MNELIILKVKQNDYEQPTEIRKMITDKNALVKNLEQAKNKIDSLTSK